MTHTSRVPVPEAIEDKNVFLIMGVYPDHPLTENERDPVVAAVVAESLQAALESFERVYRAVPMTWPSLDEIKQTVGVLERVKNGELIDWDVIDPRDHGATKNWDCSGLPSGTSQEDK